MKKNKHDCKYKEFVYIDPLTFIKSAKVFSDKNHIKIAEKVYQHIISEYSKNNIIIPPTLILYIQNAHKPKNIYGFEANIASFNLKLHTVNINLNGKTQVLNINNNLPRIIRIEVPKHTKKQIMSNVEPVSTISSDKKYFAKDYLRDQVYNIDSLFQNLSANDYVIFINEYSANTFSQMFKFTTNYESFIDTINETVCPEWTKISDFNIQIYQTVKNMSAHITHTDPDDHRIVETEITIYSVNDKQQRKIYQKLSSIYKEKLTK
jgi:hypothetical protein